MIQSKAKIFKMNRKSGIGSWMEAGKKKLRNIIQMENVKIKIIKQVQEAVCRKQNIGQSIGQFFFPFPFLWKDI